MKEWLEPVRELNACQDALEWAEQYDSLAEAWTNCERGDWMLWLLGILAGKRGSDSHRKLVLVACQCARLALQYVPKGELRPLRAIETAEGWARKEAGITLKDVKKASDAAARATYATYAADASHAAAYASCAAAHVADAACAAAHVADAACAAAHVADAAARAARKESLRRCASIVREYYPEPPTFISASKV